MKTLIFLAGPTGVGKTKTAIHMARMLDAEIISCDSMQVYKGMDIGTQKPTAAQRKKVPHHMLDIVPVSKNFSAAAFRVKAVKIVKDIEARNKAVIITGGTALYMKALIDGLFKSPPADYKLRQALQKQEHENSRGYLHKRLQLVDPQTANLIHPNDTRRVIRALEVYEKTKVPVSELKKNTKGLKDYYDIKVFCLSRQRQELYRLIEKRVDTMFRKGLLAECRRLKRSRLSMTACQALGYKEVFDYLDKKISLCQAKELIKKNTRNYAKRQLSWFRNDKRIKWIDAGSMAPAETARFICRKFMK
jgi:tRNA dimethylallyltransferase